MKHRAASAFCTLVLAAALILSPRAGVARDKGAKAGGTATSSAAQTTEKTKKRPPRAYSGKDPQPAARSQDK